LAFNINGFVGNVNRHLVRVLWSFGRLASATTSEAGRRAAISASFDGFLNVSLSVSTEIPQGSSSSPILSVICSGPLDPKLTAKADIPLPLRSYRDDFAVLVISESLSDSVVTLSKGLPELRGLLQNVGMSVMTLSPAISQPNIQGRLSCFEISS
jgi:hypothetical protein